MKLPAIPGMEFFQGKSFHTGRWDYEYTGGDMHDPNLDKLADKVVGVIGTGASADPVRPAAGASRRSTLYVFQRTPSAVGVRGNRPDRPTTSRATCDPGWQRERMDNFQRQS